MYLRHVILPLLSYVVRSIRLEPLYEQRNIKTVTLSLATTTCIVLYAWDSQTRLTKLEWQSLPHLVELHAMNSGTPGLSQITSSFRSLESQLKRF